VVSTVWEELDKAGNGRKLADCVTTGRKVQTRTEDGARFVRRLLLYPFPAGLVEDPITLKPAEEKQTTAQMAHALGEWLKEIEQLQANGGAITYINSDGKRFDRKVEVGKLIPS